MIPGFAILSLAFWLLIIGGGFYVVTRLVRAYEQRGSGTGELEQLRERLLRLEDSIETMNTRIERITEAQQFTTKLLTERSESDSSSEP